MFQNELPSGNYDVEASVTDNAGNLAEASDPGSVVETTDSTEDSDTEDTTTLISINHNRCGYNR